MGLITNLLTTNPPIEIGGYNMLHPYGILKEVDCLKSYQ